MRRCPRQSPRRFVYVLVFANWYRNTWDVESFAACRTSLTRVPSAAMRTSLLPTSMSWEVRVWMQGKPLSYCCVVVCWMGFVLLVGYRAKLHARDLQEGCLSQRWNQKQTGVGSTCFIVSHNASLASNVEMKCVRNVRVRAGQRLLILVGRMFISTWREQQQLEVGYMCFLSTST